VGASAAATAAATAALDAFHARSQQQALQHLRPFSDAELDALLPAAGYVIVPVPPGYVPKRDPAVVAAAAATLAAAESAAAGAGGVLSAHTASPIHGAASAGAVPPALAFADATDSGAAASAAALGLDLPPELENIPFTKEDDVKHFGKLLEKVDASTLSTAEQHERAILMLLLKVKNGAPPQRKTALKALTEKARVFGPAALFSVILPLFMSPELDALERHRLVKVIDRVLYRLDDLVRPYVHKLLVVIQPMLLDADVFARTEARELIANLSKAAGLASMISTMRADIDSPDEYVRNATARALAIVASTLGVQAMVPFLKAVAHSTRSWEARHTGIKVVQQIAILVGCSVLPHLPALVDTVKHGLTDDSSKVRCITALSLAALAEASFPYGIDAFDDVLPPLWQGARTNRGMTLGGFLKAVGAIVPLMAPEHAGYYAKNALEIVVREFASADSEMKRTVLAVVRQLVAAEGVDAEYVRTEIVPPFFAAFWNRRMALDARNRRAVGLATVDLAVKVGGASLVARIVDDLKDESVQYRHMVSEAVESVVTQLGVADVDKRLEERIVDGLIHAFQMQITAVGADEVEHSHAANAVLKGFAAVLTTFGPRARDYVPQVCGMVKLLLNNRSPRMRQQAADLLARVAPVIAACGEEATLCRLGVVLFESLGEEYPDVLASVIGALRAVVRTVGTDAMTPPVRDLLPRLTPILKNKHDRVQEHLIDLIGCIADQGAEHVSQKEWMRICFDLLDLLRAPRKSIRRAAANTFGFIARAIGPHEVLVTLLNNLKVQDRTSRVCTSVAIAIVAETCQPFTVIPALMNEYRAPDLNVQNGVLKTLSFLFEYVGELGKDYVYAVAPLLEDALTDRDTVHRQTACTVVKHIALGVVGLGREDVLLHLLNLVWPNMFETSPHVLNAVSDAVEGLRLALGPARMMQYLLAGLFHPARRVRAVYWRYYNTMYVACQDAMVAAYPRVPDDEHNDNRRWELELIL
jgi:splicing factor 3B subunit 1